MALPEGLDTPFFEKVAFYMDTLDQLVDFKELRQLYIDQATNNAKSASEAGLSQEQVEYALAEIMEFQDWEFWNYIIVNMMLFWMLKKGIGPNASDNAFHTCHHLMYSYDIFRRRNLIAEGKKPEPLFTQDDLDS